MPKSFLALPVEIHLKILGECGPNDVACLSLTWYVSASHPHILTYSQNLHSIFLWNISEEFKIPRLSLSTVDSRPCSPHHRTDKKPVIVTGPHPPPEGHRRLCHAESRAAFLGRAIPLDEDFLDAGHCKTLGWISHCECYAVTLYKRLEGWVPPDLKFCANCRIFTYRCSKDSRLCGMNIRRAKYELKLSGMRRGYMWGTWTSGVSFRSLRDAESSQMGAAESTDDLMQMLVTRQRIQKEGLEEMSRKRDEDQRKRQVEQP
jgi:hypothetical protein